MASQRGSSSFSAFGSICVFWKGRPASHVTMSSDGDSVNNADWLKCSLRVRHAPIDATPFGSPFYEGIYSVTMRETVEIAFVPLVVRTAADWTTEVPADLDRLTSRNQARLATMLWSSYSVAGAGGPAARNVPASGRKRRSRHHIFRERGAVRSL